MGHLHSLFCPLSPSAMHPSPGEGKAPPTPPRDNASSLTFSSAHRAAALRCGSLGGCVVSEQSPSRDCWGGRRNPGSGVQCLCTKPGSASFWPYDLGQVTTPWSRGFHIVKRDDSVYLAHSPQDERSKMNVTSHRRPGLLSVLQQWPS